MLSLKFDAKIKKININKENYYLGKKEMSSITIIKGECWLTLKFMDKEKLHFHKNVITR